MASWGLCVRTRCAEDGGRMAGWSLRPRPCDRWNGRHMARDSNGEAHKRKIVAQGNGNAKDAKRGPQHSSSSCCKHAGGTYVRLYIRRTRSTARLSSLWRRAKRRCYAIHTKRQTLNIPPISRCRRLHLARSQKDSLSSSLLPSLSRSHSPAHPAHHHRPPERHPRPPKTAPPPSAAHP